MRSVMALVIAALVAGGCSTTPPSTSTPTPTPSVAGDATIFAGSSLTDAFKTVGDEITKTNPGAHFTFNFGSSSTLATQIINGAPADVFASADDANMQRVVDAKLTDGDPAAFVGNRLQIAVVAGNPKKITSLADLARPDVVLVLAAPTVPAGKYALGSLAKAGVTAKPKSQEVDVRAVLNKVSLGEADAGIVYVTDVKSAGDRLTGVDIQEQYQIVARYPIALVKGSKSAAVAHKFVDYLLSPAGQSLLGEFGFTKP